MKTIKLLHKSGKLVTIMEHEGGGVVVRTCRPRGGPGPDLVLELISFEEALDIVEMGNFDTFHMLRDVDQ